MRRVRMEEAEEALRVIMITSVKTTGGGSWRLSGCLQRARRSVEIVSRSPEPEL